MPPTPNMSTPRQPPEEGSSQPLPVAHHLRSNGSVKTTTRNSGGESGSFTSSSVDHRQTNHNRSAVGQQQQQQQQPPLFQRIVTEEVQGIKAYAKMVEHQSQQLADRERVHKDLEARLQSETRKKQLLELALESREREWESQLQRVQSEREKWKRAVEEEQKKNKNLSEQLVRKGQDIHRMLQRKYDSEKKPHVSRQYRDKPPTSSAGSSPDLRSSSVQNALSPHEYFRRIGTTEERRERTTHDLLRDFFGL